MELTRFWEFGRKIVAIGRNYANHAKEMKAETPSQPFFFLKPTSSYLHESSSRSIEIPPGRDVHHEVELGVIIKKVARNVDESEAMEYIGGYCLCLDLTARDEQAKAKQSGLPWTASKGYDTFCPVSGFITQTSIPDPTNVQLWLKVDDENRQDGNTSDMIFSIPSLISYVSKIMTLEPGDMIATGTPEGVGPIKPGQTVVAGLHSLSNGYKKEIKFKAILRNF